MWRKVKEEVCFNKANVLTPSDYFICILLSLAFAASPYYIESGNCKLGIGFWISTIATFVFFVGITYLLRNYLKNGFYKERRKLKRKVFFEKMINDKYSVFKIACIIFVCWLPILVFLYPGTVINDTWGELQQFILFMDGKGSLFDHHPIFDTFIMGILIVPFAQMTGKWHISIFLYVILQAFITSFVFSYTINYIYKKLEIGIEYTIGFFLMYCFLPIFPTSVQTISKDALFSWIYVMFLISFMEIIRSKGERVKNKKFLVSFIIYAILCCLTKKIGMYIVLFSLGTLLLFQNQSRRYVFFSIICTVLFMFAIMPIVYNKLNVIPGGKQEMFSIPFQQTARYVNYYGDDMTEEEYIVIDKVLTMADLAERYDPINADPVKNYYQKGTDEDYIRYISVWIKQGLRHPDVYISAICAMLAGWFSWTEYDPLMDMEWHSQLNNEIIPEWVSTRGLSKMTADMFQDTYHKLYDNPLMKLFLCYGVYASLIPAFIIGSVLKKWENKEVKYWLVTVPMIGSVMLGCWLAPVSIHFEGRRYLYPIIYTTPLMLAWCVYIYKNNIKKTKEVN